MIRIPHSLHRAPLSLTDKFMLYGAHQIWINLVVQQEPLGSFIGAEFVLLKFTLNLIVWTSMSIYIKSTEKAKLKNATQE